MAVAGVSSRGSGAARATRSATRGVRAAFVTLTRLPAGGFPYDDENWRWSSAHFPLVGACVGGIASLAWAATTRAGYGVAAVVATAASLLLTGAMHEDGLADTADALGGGGGDRARIFAIMKDSRVGTYGASAIAVTILLRAALLMRLGPLAPAALLAEGCASRLVPVWLIARLPYVTDPSSQKSAVIAQAGTPQLVVAALWTLAIALPCLWWAVPSPLTLVVLAAPLALCGAGAASLFRARIGGITGDTLGAAQQVTSLAILLTLAVAVGGAGGGEP